MKLTVTGATGLIGSRLVTRLKSRGDEVMVLSRDPERARAELGVEAFAWQPPDEVAPASALAGRDAVVNLLGESVGQRWSARVKERLRTSRVDATNNLVAGVRAAEPRPGMLLSASAVGYYGARGDERLEESEPPGDDFLARLCVDWEAAARSAGELGLRVVVLRQGIVLAKEGGALGQMLLPFRLGLGGPLASGRQYFSWIGVDDLIAIMLRALDDEGMSGVFNATAPGAVTNREFVKALGRALHRPAVLRVPAPALRLILGEAADGLISGQRVVPARLVELGHRFEHPELEPALRATLAG